MVFAKSVGSLWGPLLYCLGATVLQVVFCLGESNPLNYIRTQVADTIIK